MEKANDFSVMLTAAFLFSGLIFVVMMKIQKKRIAEAEKTYRLFLKSKGINPDLEN